MLQLWNSTVVINESPNNCQPMLMFIYKIQALVHDLRSRSFLGWVLLAKFSGEKSKLIGWQSLSLTTGIDNPALWSFESVIVSKEQGKELAIRFINCSFIQTKPSLILDQVICYLLNSWHACMQPTPPQGAKSLCNPSSNCLSNCQINPSCP